MSLIAGKWKPWTKKDDVCLRRNYNRLNSAELAAQLKRSKASIKNRLHKLRLYRTPSVRRQMSLAPLQKGWGWNKGKYSRWSPATEFKRGHRPANTKRDGCVTVRRHKRTGIASKFIRIALGRWIPLAHAVWQQQHGVIPPKHIIGFKNGDTLDCRLENLYCLSKADNARRNQNIEKARVSIRKHWESGKNFESDAYVAWTLAPFSRALRENIKKDAGLLELQRLKLKLNYAIKKNKRKER